MTEVTGEWVQIIHPETGGVAEVHRDSLAQWYAGGWRLLAPDDPAAAPPEPPAEPEPMTRAQAAEAAEQAASADTEES